MACTIGGVPASNRAGSSAGSKPAVVTWWIMLPPPRNGGIASNSSRRPYSTPTPVGPSILCPLKARKSARAPARRSLDAARSAPRRSAPAPKRCAAATIVSMGLMVPNTFDMAVTATMLRARRRNSSSRSIASRPSSVIGSQRMTAPVRTAACCQGTIFEWCSISVSRISSPGHRLASPQLRQPG